MAVFNQEEEIPCDKFASWHSAFEACQLIALNEEVPPAKGNEWALILSTFAKTSDRFFFTQVDLPVLTYSQSQVHGLLGQRAVSITPLQAGYGDIELPGIPLRSATSEGMHMPERSELEAGASEPSINSDKGPRGHQGEGMIEGVYTDYAVHSLHTHENSFKFSRFTQCPD
eukprot:502880-Pleurochrysis_carterae.AAC.2